MKSSWRWRSRPRSRRKRRTRVLPSAVVARKVHSLALIEHQLARYAGGERSLRQVSWDLLGEKTPAHTSLFGWSEGLGAHALGRAKSGPAPEKPVSRLLSESESRCPSIGPVLVHPAPVDPRRYRSSPRRERLSAMATLLVVAGSRAAPAPLSEWRRLAFTWTRLLRAPPDGHGDLRVVGVRVHESLERDLGARHPPCVQA